MYCARSSEFFISDPSYSEFLHNKMPGENGAADIFIDVYFGNLHDKKNLRDCFDTGQYWSLFRTGDDYLLKFQREGAGKPYMTALVSHDISRVELFCSDDFADNEGRTYLPVQYPLDQILLMLYLVNHEGVIAHSAGMSFHENGYLFPGCSGAGKSTVSRSLSGGDNVILLSDDRIIIRKMADAFMVYGTPWPGEAGIAVNRSAPLRGIFFLEKGPDNIIKPIDETEALKRFMPVLSVPWFDRDYISEALSLVSELLSKVPSHLIHFKPGKEVVYTLGKFVAAQHVSDHV